MACDIKNTLYKNGMISLEVSKELFELELFNWLLKESVVK